MVAASARALLALVLLAAGAGAADGIVFPPGAGVVDVTKEPYRLVGDGRTDCTPGLRRAFADLGGSNRTLWFPDGVYLFSDRVNISADEPSQPHSRDRFVHLQGQSRAGVILRLRDDAPGFGDPAAPKTFLSLYEGKSTGDVMHSYVRDLTIEIGSGNPGACAFRFMTNNSGAMYDVTIRSRDAQGRGAIGLDLRQGQLGPGLIKRVAIEGFDHGIQLGETFSMVFEHLELRGQRQAGVAINNARTIFRGVASDNAVPAFTVGKHGQLTLVEAKLRGGAAEAAIRSEGSQRIYLRDVTSEGYRAAMRTGAGKLVPGPIGEWYDGSAHALFGAKTASLRLPIVETPEIPWQTDLAKWVAVATGEDTVQKAIDTAAARSATTVYFPKLERKAGKYVITRPVRVHGSVNRIIGMEEVLWVDERIEPGQAVFVIEDTRGPLVFERFFAVVKNGGWRGLNDRFLFENRTAHDLVVRNVSCGPTLKKPAPGQTLFVEDVPGLVQVGPDERCWARQFNPEAATHTMAAVDGGQLWILGMKTEGRATHIDAGPGARVELIGGVSYQSWAKQPLDPPMFVIREGAQVSLTFGFYHHETPFTTIVAETLGGRTLTLERKQLTAYHLPLYRSGGR